MARGEVALRVGPVTPRLCRDHLAEVAGMVPVDLTEREKTNGSNHP
jgi:hypothetical protein